MRCLLVFLLAALPVFSQAVWKETGVEVSFDPLLDIPASFEIDQDKFETIFACPEIPGGTEEEESDGDENPFCFSWMTQDRDRAVFMKWPLGRKTKFLMFGGEVPCEEVTVDFNEGKVSGVSISIYNRADSKDVGVEEFQQRFLNTGKEMKQRISGRAMSRKPDAKQGLLTEGWSWFDRQSMAVLERNPEAAQGSLEFLRLRLAPRGASGPIANSVRSGNDSRVRKSDLPDHVTHQGGDVWIRDIPMVDQGPKGYCVVASIQRLFEHYGIPCDQHQIAEMAESDARAGTSSLAVMKLLGTIDYRFKTRFDVLGIEFTSGRLYSVKVRSGDRFDPGSEFDEKDFEKQLVRHIDAGIPLLWSLQLGHFPEEPPISEQAVGGHMRLIIGYNLDEKKVIFSDSWGAGHEKKKMKMHDAFRATTGIFTITPTIN
ncbi:C39 family peptidase [Haloferula sargassicola]|uniref:Peptidase C39-like domain-containing protein n=1 Tax=Haloferula sargassicola TaxID=490096 RepID=A0ABP9UQG1_9BACT